MKDATHKKFVEFTGQTWKLTVSRILEACYIPVVLIACIRLMLDEWRIYRIEGLPSLLIIILLFTTIILALTDAVWLMYAIKCPKCEIRVGKLYSKYGIMPWVHKQLMEISTCPKCGYPGATTPLNKTNKKILF